MLYLRGFVLAVAVTLGVLGTHAAWSWAAGGPKAAAHPNPCPAAPAPGWWDPLCP